MSKSSREQLNLCYRRAIAAGNGPANGSVVPRGQAEKKGISDVPRTVLLVDDDPDVRETLAAMLEDLGCDVVTAETGLEALEQISGNQRIEILVTDINMPGMDGRELAQRAKKLRADLHVMLLSGREPGDGFPVIRKPFSEDDLADAMRRATGQTC